MDRVTYAPGTVVAWRTPDGVLMAGVVEYVGAFNYCVKRVDGASCIVSQSKCRVATLPEALAAYSFFTEPKQ